MVLEVENAHELFDRFVAKCEHDTAHVRPPPTPSLINGYSSHAFVADQGSSGVDCCLQERGTPAACSKGVALTRSVAIQLADVAILASTAPSHRKARTARLQQQQQQQQQAASSAGNVCMTLCATWVFQQVTAALCFVSAPCAQCSCCAPLQLCLRKVFGSHQSELFTQTFDSLLSAM